MKTTSLIEKKRPVHARFLNAAKAETEAEFRDADVSRRIVPLSSHVSMRKARTVLVPVDFTESSHRALDYALPLAECLQASIVVLHVVDRFYAEGFLDTPAKHSVRTEAHRRAREKLDRVAEAKSNRVVRVHFHLNLSGIQEAGSNGALFLYQ